MGYRIHICSKYALVGAEEDGKTVGYDLSVRYSQGQRDWFNNLQGSLAQWMGEYGDEIFLDEFDREWVVEKKRLEALPDEAFKNPPPEVTEEELRRFVAESVKCAQPDGLVYYMWL